MKTLIVALNSKYIHSALAPWYLKANCDSHCGETKVMEFTINDNMDSVLANIYRESPDVIAFSCYIWNISYTTKVAENIKKLLPDSKIVIGGPEVSFGSQKIMTDHPFIDFIIKGEGELVFPRLLQILKSGNVLDKEIEGLVDRRFLEKGEPSYQLIDNLDAINSPYSIEMLSALKNRIIYFESSRGCPFSCSYCLSSTFNGVRYFPIERVKAELNKIIDFGVTQIKFVDRTFNCNKERAKEIFKFIIEKGQIGISTNFHFEIAGDLLDDEIFDILEKAPQGLIQFEIGVQTTNEKTLNEVNRKTDLDILFKNVTRLRNLNNIHIHLDLIAGLPLEDFSSFKNSFDSVYSFRPHQLQLGFLKMLKGSSIREKATAHGYKYRSYPTYEVLYNQYLSYDEILVLKDVEEVVDRYFNTGRFVNSLDYIINFFQTPFNFYQNLSAYYRDQGYMDKPPSARDLYSLLVDFARSFMDEENCEKLNELLKFDFLVSDNSNNLPRGINRELKPGFKELCFEFLKDEANISKYLKNYEGMPAKQIYKQVHIETFAYNVIDSGLLGNVERGEITVLFDYRARDRVSGLYEYKVVCIKGA